VEIWTRNIKDICNVNERVQKKVRLLTGSGLKITENNKCLTAYLYSVNNKLLFCWCHLSFVQLCV